MFYFVVHYAYFSCMSCLEDFAFWNINLTTWKMLIVNEYSGEYSMSPVIFTLDHLT